MFFLCCCFSRGGEFLNLLFGRGKATRINILKTMMKLFFFFLTSTIFRTTDAFTSRPLDYGVTNSPIRTNTQYELSCSNAILIKFRSCGIYKYQLGCPDLVSCLVPDLSKSIHILNRKKSFSTLE